VGTVFFPLDEELGLLPGKWTPLLQEQLVRLSTWMPFGQAAKILGDFMRLGTVSEATTRRYTEAAGAAYVDCQTSAVVEMEKRQPNPNRTSGRLCFSVDGAMVPLNTGEWAEAKTLVIGTVQPTATPEGSGAKLGDFSRLADKVTFERLALVETERRGLVTAEQVAAVGDGAEWVQGFVDYHRPDAVRILDFPHAAEHLYTLGAWALGDGQTAPAEWFAQTLHQLKHAGPPALASEWQTWREAYPEQAEIQKSLTYLDKRLAQMDYPRFQAEGWPLGSGAVESANKLVVEARLKGSGMRWARAHVDSMLALRNAVCNDRWAEAWQVSAKALRRQPHPQPRPSAIPLSTPTQALPPKPTPAPRPKRSAAQHPWRNSPIGRARFRPKPVHPLPPIK